MSKLHRAKMDNYLSSQNGEDAFGMFREAIYWRRYQLEELEGRL
jgi:hypothetical protein